MAGYPTDTPAAAAARVDVPVPCGYSGNLTSIQTAALAAVVQALQAFIQEREASADVSAAEAEVAEPTDPIKPAAPAEEAAEAKELVASESNLLRFCRARDFDVANASAMAIDCCKWRASVKPQSITPEMIPNSLPSGTWRFAGYAKSGMPVIEINTAHWKPSDYYGLDEYIRYVAYFCEGAMARMGSGVERMLVIFQMESFSFEMMKPFATRCVGQLISITQNYYPERLGITFLCKSPWIFQTFWKIVRPLIDAKTFQKIKFADSESNEALLSYIDNEQLSIELGGAHPLYPLLSRSVQQEADAFYAQLGGRDKLPPATDQSALTGILAQTAINGGVAGETSGTKDIDRGTTFVLEVSVEGNTKSVSWNFRTEAHDIGFGYKVVVVPSLEEANELTNGDEASMIEKASQAPERQDASIKEGVSGKLDVDKSWAGGILYLTFDNSHSRFRSKTVSYTINVEA